MSYYYLKFPDEATAISILPEFRREDEWITGSSEHALYIVGIIYRIEDNTPTEGFHVNLSGTLPEEHAALDYQTEPVSPRVTWGERG